MLDMELEMQRLKIESQEKRREICNKIPPLNFKKEWNVKIFPPFGGALARFWIGYKTMYQFTLIGMEDLAV